MTQAFWDDLQEDIRDDPQRAERLALEVARIRAIDHAVNAIDQAREANGISKAELAAKVGKNPAWMRRLFTRPGQNPQFGTVAAMAMAVGYRIELVPNEPTSAVQSR